MSFQKSREAAIVQSLPTEFAQIERSSNIHESLMLEQSEDHGNCIRRVESDSCDTSDSRKGYE